MTDSLLKILDYDELAAAIQDNDAETLEWLLSQGVDANAENEFGQSILWRALNERHMEMVCALIRHGANVNDKKGANGSTPLMEAAAAGHLETVRVLLERGAEVNTTNINNWTALTWSAAGGNIEVMRLLIETGADTAKYGKFAQQIAQLWWRNDMIELLDNAGQCASHAISTKNQQLMVAHAPAITIKRRPQL